MHLSNKEKMQINLNLIYFNNVFFSSLEISNSPDSSAIQMKDESNVPHQRYCFILITFKCSFSVCRLRVKRGVGWLTMWNAGNKDEYRWFAELLPAAGFKWQQGISNFLTVQLPSCWSLTCFWKIRNNT